MKKAVIFSFTLILIAITFISCENEDGSDDSRYRLLQIADNAAMENPFCIFEYDTKGKVVKIYRDDEVIEIEYNQVGKPVKITGYGTKNMEWNGNSCIIASYDRKEILNFNDKNQLESEVYLVKHDSQSDFDTLDVLTVSRIDNKNVKLIKEYYPIGSGGWEETFQFGEMFSPFKNIDVSILMLTDMSFGEWEIEFQNEFNLIAFDEGSGYSATIDYDVEYGKFPVRAAVKYSSNSEFEYVYFLYEKY